MIREKGIICSIDAWNRDRDGILKEALRGCYPPHYSDMLEIVEVNDRSEGLMVYVHILFKWVRLPKYQYYWPYAGEFNEKMESD